ncbi:MULTISPECIES: MFS transporter [Frankia]|uniref:Transmembrane efflux protein n=1 Tax=Frankia alni (strain DSM 45986 / CECT 9034 / ACN14a) TaxID=326424 RepID=Q0RN74_FRAAA|nr:MULTISPECIES: MFS transporter [Frankia]CAJ61015.1 Putative transmembrane efflux protein [Frankia alni ACN14a]
MDGLRVDSPAGRWVLAATVLGSAIASIDATVVGIALPAIGRDLHAGLSSLQWVVTGYTLTLAGLLLVAGDLGDRYGRRRTFLVGVVWFVVASMGCAVAPSGPVLIGSRALQGVGAALLTPGSLAILEASFAPQDRSRAIGTWSGLSGVATAVGPFLGGWLVEVWSWRLIFLINLPVAAAVIVLAWRHVPESRDPQVGGRVDVVGGALVTLGLVGLTYGLIEGPGAGWTGPPVLVALVAGALLLVAFVGWERRTPAPMLPLELFAARQFAATNLVTFTVYAALGGTLFLLPIQLQQVCGYSALRSGVALLPVTVIMLLLSARSGALAARIGPRLQMSVGPVLVGVGLALLRRVDAAGSYLTDVLPAVAVFGLGLAVTVAPLTSTALSAVPARHAGIASAVNNDVARAAGLIAVAVLPAAAGITGASYLRPAEFSRGFHTAVLLAAGLCALGGVIAALTIRNPPRPATADAATRPAAPREPLTPVPRWSHCCLDAPPPPHPDSRRLTGGPAAASATGPAPGDDPGRRPGGGSGGARGPR